MSASARIDARGSWQAVPWTNGMAPTPRSKAISTPCASATKFCSANWSRLVLERAMERSVTELNRSATELAVEEMDKVVNEWFAHVLKAPPAGAEMLSTRGRMALLLADMPGRWQGQFLNPGPWPDEFVMAMRDGYLRAGPDFQLAKMTPRPFDLGPIATITHWTTLPYVKMAASWVLFGLLLILLFYITHQ